MTDKHPNPTSLLELAERCEKATGPDRVLDYEIARDLGLIAIPRDVAITKVTRIRCEYVHYEDGGLSQGKEARAYTASLDAAMTLIPKGWAFKLGRSWCELIPISSELTDEEWPEDWDEDRQHYGKTPALALCAAALRARQS